MHKLYEGVKLDIGLKPQALNNTNATGEYYAMKDYRGALAVLSVGAMAVEKTAKLEFLQATNNAGGSAKGIPSTAAQAATAEITANTNVSECTVVLSSVAAADAVIINGLTFTAHANTTTVASRQFKIDGTDSADADALVSCINDETYGVPGVTASNSNGTITLKSTDRGKTTLTVTSAAATFTIATTQALAYVEIENLSLDYANDFSHFAAKVTTSANTVVSVAILRGPGRDAITQAVGASASA